MRTTRMIMVMAAGALMLLVASGCTTISVKRVEGTMTTLPQQKQKTTMVKGNGDLDNTVKRLRDYVSEANSRGGYVKYFCFLPGAGMTGGNSAFDAMAVSQMSQHFSQRNPGSTVNCSTLSGTWVDGNVTYYIQKAQVYKAIVLVSNGLTHEYDFPEKGNSIFYIRISDSQGSNIIIEADLNNSNNVKFVEAKLPVSVQSSGTVSGRQRGFQYSGDELVPVMNECFKRVVQLERQKYGKTTATLMAYANALLLHREERDELLKSARQIIGSQSPSRRSVGNTGERNTGEIAIPNITGRKTVPEPADIPDAAQ